MFGNRKDRRKQRQEVKDYVKGLSDRECGSCNACCVLLSIPALLKGAGVACKHLRPERDARACARYDTRPKACADFHCLWRLDLAPGFERPDKSGIVFLLRGEGKLVWAEAHAEDVMTFERHRDEIDALASVTERVIVMRTPKTQMVHCVGPLDDVEQIRQLFAARIESNKRRLAIVS